MNNLTQSTNLDIADRLIERIDEFERQLDLVKVEALEEIRGHIDRLIQFAGAATDRPTALEEAEVALFEKIGGELEGFKVQMVLAAKGSKNRASVRSSTRTERSSKNSLTRCGQMRARSHTGWANSRAGRSGTLGRFSCSKIGGRITIHPTREWAPR